ncbi:MAG: hypothetical protein GY847_18430 [Proteobacteria bacterium]|nr:hypothetical protein [Pseudomonadota bacterium]
MKRSNKNMTESKIAHTLLAATALLAMACGVDFEDGSMASLKKPEILSVVLSPPEAAPGEQVSASFLIADDKGVIEGKASLWMPIGEEPMDEAAMDEALSAMNLTIDDLAAPTLELTVPPADMFGFDEQGFSGLPLSVAAAHGDGPASDAPATELLADLEQHVESGKMKMATRTLIVSERNERNENPHVLSVHSGTEESQKTELTIVRSDDDDIAAARQAAADNPLVLSAESETWFRVEVEDDGEVEETVRYQWISTGGDFFGLRERVQEWEVPEYKSLSGNEQDQTGLENVDPRTDPNLHPVWLIVRDDMAENQLGQTWAEFYIRVEPSK